jgi:hypothetical protein
LVDKSYKITLTLEGDEMEDVEYVLMDVTVPAAFIEPVELGITYVFALLGTKLLKFAWFKTLIGLFQRIGLLSSNISLD